MYQKPTIAVGSVSTNGTIVQQILKNGVMVLVPNANKPTLLTFRECEILFH